MKRIALVTGASSGIGRTAAEQLAAQGFTVYTAARSMDKLMTFASDTIKPIHLDVTDDTSMQACVEQVLAEAGQIDVLVNNAGYGSFGAVEDVSMAEARRQLEVNLFGLARMTQLVLPAMRSRRRGRIINIASMAGRIWVPFGAWYNATKFAVEGFSSSLRLELKPFNIQVVLIEPGSIRTPWSDIAVKHLRDASANGAYAAGVEQTARHLSRIYRSAFASKPELIGKRIVKAATAKKPRPRYLLGFGAKPMVWLQKLLGDRVYDAFVRGIL